MTKTFKPDQVIGYDLAKTFTATIRHGGFEVLKNLANSKNQCVIRGQPKATIDCANFFRRLDCVDDRPIDWVLLDYDGSRPDYAPDLISDPVGAALSVLPECLKGVGFYWQLGSSAGVKANKYSIHIWIQLESPLSGDQIKPALKEWGFDESMSRAVQVHYTASPVFDGILDPVKNRCGIVDGEKAKVKPFIIAAKQAEKKDKMERIISSKYLNSVYSGPMTSLSDLLRNELHDIITESKGDVFYCNCPRHSSDSRKSLHVNLNLSKWYCHKCERGGKTAYSLAYFVANDDKEATKIILQRVNNVIR